MIKVKFLKEHLLTIADFDTVLFSPSPSKKGEILSTKLINYIFIYNHQLYVINENKYYNVCDDIIDNVLWIIIESLLTQSIDAFDNNENNILRDKTRGGKSSLQNLMCKRSIMSFIDPVKNEITRNKVTLDSYLGQIHFLNGYIDLKDKTFKQRTSKDMITKVIQREYKASKNKSKNLLRKIFKQIYPIDEDLETMLMIFGSGLTGKSVFDQDMIFCISRGSAGKSFMLEVTRLAITDVYFHELKSDTFSTSASEMNKIFNTYQTNPQILISWVNELSTERIDISIFKNFVEGKCNTTKLYKENSHTFTHKSKVISTSQTFPNLQIDSGTSRRIKAYNNKTHFTENPEEVDESKHIYLKDKTLLLKIANDNDVLNAWIDILIDYASRYMNGENINYSENFTDAKDEVVSSNDTFQDFIDATLEITNDSSDRIGKREMHKKFHEMYPNKRLKELDIITSLKERNITYDKGVRSTESVRGCFTGVKFKGNDIDDGDDSTAVKDADKIYESILTCKTYSMTIPVSNLQKLFNHQEQLKRRITELENKLKNNIADKKSNEDIDESEDDSDEIIEIKKTVVKWPSKNIMRKETTSIENKSQQLKKVVKKVVTDDISESLTKIILG